MVLVAANTRSWGRCRLSHQLLPFTCQRGDSPGCVQRFTYVSLSLASCISISCNNTKNMIPHRLPTMSTLPVCFWTSIKCYDGYAALVADIYMVFLFILKTWIILDPPILCGDLTFCPLDVSKHQEETLSLSLLKCYVVMWKLRMSFLDRN